MAGTILTHVQLGDSTIATNNFMLTAQAADGSMKLSRGNNGATVQDILTVNASGLVTMVNGEVILASKIQSGTAVATISGTSIDFTGIPTWAKRITVMLNGVSTNGSSTPQIQIGAGSITTTGYSSAGSVFSGTAVAGSGYSTSGFLISAAGAATDVRSGNTVLTLLGSNIWTMSAIVGYANAAAGISGGNITLSGTLDRLRLTTVNGTDTFRVGSINLLWE